MRVRCRAVADYRSNALGSVELECTPRGLCIALDKVSSYRHGYAPGPPADAAEVCVPWQSVYATRLGEYGLLLSVEAKRLPLNRFSLQEFAEVDRSAPPPAEGRAVRVALGGMAAALIGVILMLAASGALPHPRVLRTLGGAAVLAALLTYLVRRARAQPKKQPHDVLRELSAELAEHLSNHVPLPVEPAPVTDRARTLPDLGAMLPRSAIGVAITLAAAGLAALVTSSAARPSAPGAAAIFSAKPSPTGIESAAPGAGEDETASEDGSDPETALDAPAIGSACRCERDESLLFREPVPRLSTLVLRSHQQTHDGHPHADLDVALVNNGDQPLERLNVSIVFFESRAVGRGTRQTGERPLYREALAPGRVARWHVEGLGSTFDVIAPDLGTLSADGSDAADADSFAALTLAEQRVLRLHGARMLAFAKDPRARPAALELRRTARPSEGSFLDRLLEAPPAVSACEIAVGRESPQHYHLSACLYNGSDEARSGVGLRLLAFDAPFDEQRPGSRSPEVLAERSARVDTALAPRAGRRVELSAPLALTDGAVPRAFEVLVDREEHQR